MKQPRTRLRKLRSHRVLSLCAAAIACVMPGKLNGSGFYGPIVYLSNGGRLVDATPQFYWRLDVKRLSAAFHPLEKRVLVPEEHPEQAETVEQEIKARFGKFTAAQDLAEFAAALKEGRVATDERAAQLHAAARAALDADTVALPEEAVSEFADYHRGAWAFKHDQAAEARAAWEALLARPKETRHYRSVWAAFMLGKLCLKDGDPAAGAWFQKARELAGAGFADSLGLAADSYGWEAASEQQQGHAHRAAELFLTQLALEDASAVDSLKELIPDNEGDDWHGAAADPLLRRLTTAYLLAFGAGSEPFSANAQKIRRWIAVLQELKIDDADGAEYFGWIAYSVGDYALAERWLARAKKDLPAALWLRAKLLRRDGKLADAAQAMLQVWKTIQREDNDLHFPAQPADHNPDTLYYSFYRSDNYGLSFKESAGGDYGAMSLSRGEFLSALDAFRNAGLWIDAAYIAEQILTTAELKGYVDKQPPEQSRLLKPRDENNSEPRFRSLRHLLGRRLVRDKRYLEAASYLPVPYNQIAKLYANALKEAGNLKLTKAARARAWFRAGWLARYAGMELMGTEGPPDNFASRGDFPADLLGEERVAGVYQETKYDGEKVVVTQKQSELKPTAAEVKRLKQNRVEPNVRFHYRIIAAQLMMKAAPLLPDDLPILADVINRAGLIVKGMDPALADEFYQQLERRCEHTEIGQAAMVHRWFVPVAGEWSAAEQAALETLLAIKQ